ncbi:hypothetical protein FJT64_005278 [Amphibalanus amphitrite]|uniref:Apple domain-containing protein n=1 Tax=Amphibalanus amphitrite TaxID=1232801 RepID=A0A6A4VWI5_AMPAM|nr:hypothetical protein FJT64_005278 [Amphibalanus amphitrite]
MPPLLLICLLAATWAPSEGTTDYTHSGDYSHTEDYSHSADYSHTEDYSHSGDYSDTEDYSHSGDYSDTGDYSHSWDYSHSADSNIPTKYWHRPGAVGERRMGFLAAYWSPTQLLSSETPLAALQVTSECRCRTACQANPRCLSYVLDWSGQCRLFRRRGSPDVGIALEDWYVYYYRTGVALPGDFCESDRKCSNALAATTCEVQRNIFCIYNHQSPLQPEHYNFVYTYHKHYNLAYIYQKHYNLVYSYHKHYNFIYIYYEYYNLVFINHGQLNLFSLNDKCRKQADAFCRDNSSHFIYLIDGFYSTQFHRDRHNSTHVYCRQHFSTGNYQESSTNE